MLTMLFPTVPPKQARFFEKGPWLGRAPTGGEGTT
jgi:hypothetical protein